MTVVFQNLLGNALKFRGEQPPRIVITADRDGMFWLFSVTDHGIGIEPEYADRIFLIFQRLHDNRGDQADRRLLHDPGQAAPLEA